MKPRQHVLPEGNEWAVISEAGMYPARKFPTREAAMHHALGLAQKAQSNVVEHNPDGSYAEHVVKGRPFAMALA